MRYWIYHNNEVLGPFDSRELSARPGFSASSLVCPESPGGGQAAEWKEASGYPEIFAAPPSPEPPPPSPRPAPAPDMLELTMRGSLVAEPVFDGGANSPAPPARGASRVGDLVFPPPAKPGPAPDRAAPAAVQPVPAPSGAADPRPEVLKKKLDQMSSALASMGESQAQLAARISALESAIADMRALLAGETPGK